MFRDYTIITIVDIRALVCWVLDCDSVNWKGQLSWGITKSSFEQQSNEWSSKKSFG